MAKELVQKQSLMTPQHVGEDSNSQTNGSHKRSNAHQQHKTGSSENRTGNSGLPTSEVKTNKTMTHEVIAEEQVEDSAHNTKRQSMDVQDQVAT